MVEKRNRVVSSFTGTHPAVNQHRETRTLSAPTANTSSNPGRITVLLVDDSSVALAVLKRMLATSTDIEVVGTARNGKEALELIPRLQPQVICTDLHMPVMDGLQLTTEIIAQFPRPILVVSVSVAQGSRNVFQLVEAGAIDVFSKPRGGMHGAPREFIEELVRKIRILSGVKVIRKLSSTKTTIASGWSGENQKADFAGRPPRIVVIGASTGGPQALHAILTRLPADFPVPLVCVQHMSQGFLEGLVKWLAAQCRLKVRIAEPGKVPQPREVYFAPEDLQLEFDSMGRFVASGDQTNGNLRPSVTITMRSAAHAFGSGAVGVLLSGMGNDGAEGMRSIAAAGGLTIAQDEKSCVVFGMPKQAIELGAANYVMAPQDIAEVLKSKVPGGAEAGR